MTKKNLAIAAAIPIFLLFVPLVHATGAARDYDERYEVVPGVPECWYDGYQDGLNKLFNEDRNEECKDKGNQYYRAFIFGCSKVEGNRETCENYYIRRRQNAISGVLDLKFTYQYKVYKTFEDARKYARSLKFKTSH